jgi:hypothetical protein
LFIAWLAVEKLPHPGLFQISLIIISLIAALVALLAVPKDDWRSATAQINQDAGDNDIVWLEPSHGNLPYGYYEPLIDPTFTVNAVLEKPDVDVWHIAERQPNRPIPGSSAEIWLDKNRELLEVFPLYRLEVRHYSAEN